MNLGLDVGFGEVKAVFANGNEEAMEAVFPSIFAKYIPTAMDAGNGIDIVEYGGVKYVVGEAAMREKAQVCPGDFRDIIENVGIYVAFLRRMTGIDETTHVVVASIPPLYWKQMSDYRIQLSTMFNDVAVVPQGLGAARMVLDNLDVNGRYIVVDIGYNTVDHLLVEVVERNGEKKVFTRRGGTWRSSGVTFLTDIFKSEMGDTDIRGLRFHSLKTFLRDGKAVFHGDTIDLSGAKRRAGEQYMRSIGSRIKDEFGGELDHIDGIIATGGGVYYLDVSNIFGGLPVITSEKPEFANAHGQMLLAA